MTPTCQCGADIRFCGKMCHQCGAYLSEARRRGSRALISEPGAVFFLLVVGVLYAICTVVACQTDVRVGFGIGCVGALVVLALGIFLRRNLG
jgi:hypothetical protein